MPADPEFVLYWNPGTSARVPLIALEEIGVPFETRLLQRGDPAAMADYKSGVNPKGKVPALVVDGRSITENPAIHTYLHGRFPQAGLLPSDPDESLEALIMMSWFAAGIHPMIGRSRFPMHSSAVPESFDSIREIACANLRDCFAQIEERLKDREWLFDRWTIVDGYLLWCWFRAVGSGLTADEFPIVDAAMRRCQERPSVSRALDREAQTYEELERAGLAMPDAPPLVAGWMPELV